MRRQRAQGGRNPGGGARASGWSEASAIIDKGRPTSSSPSCPSTTIHPYPLLPSRPPSSFSYHHVRFHRRLAPRDPSLPHGLDDCQLARLLGHHHRRLADHYRPSGVRLGRRQGTGRSQPAEPARPVPVQAAALEPGACECRLLLKASPSASIERSNVLTAGGRVRSFLDQACWHRRLVLTALSSSLRQLSREPPVAVVVACVEADRPMTSLILPGRPTDHRRPDPSCIRYSPTPPAEWNDGRARSRPPFTRPPTVFPSSHAHPMMTLLCSPHHDRREKGRGSSHSSGLGRKDFLVGASRLVTLLASYSAGWRALRRSSRGPRVWLLAGQREV